MLILLSASAGQARGSNVPSNVTNAAVVGDNQGKTNDKQEESADTKVNVDDAVVAKAPDGEEVDFKKISIDEALKVLKVCHPFSSCPCLADSYACSFLFFCG